MNCSRKLLTFIFLCFSLPVFTEANATWGLNQTNFAALPPAQVSSFPSAMMQAQTNVLMFQQIRSQRLQNQMQEQQLHQEQQLQYNKNNEPVKIMIFSQNKYPTYLGCFNCPVYREDSVHNDGGKYGNTNSKKSIFNSHGVYGSIHSDLSVCNSHALHPPVIADNRGTVYGLLTLNIRLRNAVREPVILKWLKTHVCTKH